jgi:hypothetical protein
MHLGVGRETVLDKHQWQLGLDYANAGSPEGVRKLLRDVGVTHVYFVPGRSDTIDSLAGDLIFHEFAANHAASSKRVGGGLVFAVPAAPTSKPFRDRVLVLSCGKAPFPGLYRLGALAVPPYGPEKDRFGRAERAASDVDSALEWLPEADFVVFDTRCDDAPPVAVSAAFDELFSRKGHAIWRRKAGRSPHVPRERAGARAPDEDPEDAEASDR